MLKFFGNVSCKYLDTDLCKAAACSWRYVSFITIEIYVVYGEDTDEVWRCNLERE